MSSIQKKGELMVRFIFIVFILYTTIFASEKPLQVIAFGSCANQNASQPVFKAIAKHKPDLMIMLGDNIYADSKTEWIEQANGGKRTPALEAKVKKYMQEQYNKLAGKEEFAKLRSSTSFIATWDDHDFGKDDIGKTFPFKDISKDLFLDFWKEPKKSPRRSQEDGIYTSYYYGDKGKRVQVIMLDSRYMRDSQYKVNAEDQKLRDKSNTGPYLADASLNTRILGDAQWKWLEAELEKPADLRILSCSIQFLSDFTGWESWSNFPKERERLIKLIGQKKAEHVIFISGDTHWSEFSKLDENLPYPLWDLTSSGINMEWREISPNRNRVGKPYYGSNFGLILIDWKNEPAVKLQIRDDKNNLIMEQEIQLSTLSFQH